MSDIIPFQDGKPTNLPSYLKDATTATTVALAGGESSGFKRISIKGNVFRLMESGQQVAESDERFMRIVVVDVAPATGRSYYAGSYKEGENSGPTCWSSDSVKPDESVEEPQAVTCGACPNNVDGSGQGGRGRACRYAHKISVVLADDIEGDIYAMNIPATSFYGKGQAKTGMPLQAYAKYLATGKLPIESIVTEMRFDSNSPVPKLLFKAAGMLPEEKFGVIMQRKEETASKIAVGKTKRDSGGGETPEPVKVDKPKVEEKSKKLNDILDEFDK